MRREFAAVAVGGVCLLALAVLVGGMESATSSAVEVPQFVQDLLTIPETTADEEGMAEFTDSERGTVGSAPGSVGPLVWGSVVVFGLWLLGAARRMTAGAAALALLAAGVVVAFALSISSGGTVPGTSRTLDVATPAVLPGVVASVLLAVVLVVGATMLVPSFEASSRGPDVMGFLRDAKRDVGGREATDGEDRGSDLDNEVYRAYKEFVDRLEEDAYASPGEVARTARNAGIPAEEVAAIRRTFEEVRYGEAPVTESRTERARSALDRIDRRLADRNAEATNDRASDANTAGGDEG